MKTVILGIAGYFVIYWTVLFVVLPFRVERDATPETGHDRGAPKQAHMKGKFIATAILAAVVWLCIFVALKMGALSGLFS